MLSGKRVILDEDDDITSQSVTAINIKTERSEGNGENITENIILHCFHYGGITVGLICVVFVQFEGTRFHFCLVFGRADGDFYVLPTADGSGSMVE